MDAELDAEQAHVDAAYEWLAWMRTRADRIALQAEGGDLDMLHALRRRAASLTDGGRPLCFGRIDEAATAERPEGATFHIGRRHVEDDHGDPVVVEWRAPVAVPFYRAAPGAPMGLVRRRQFVIDGRRIQFMADDVFGGEASGDVPRLRGGDALLVELERTRGAEMLDIVSTIQAEQDEVIRSPLPGVLVCQGGPGSGKTAVGLHRAAFLLYDEETLARRGVLVLGPNRVFLRYIAQVLPSLGEEAVIQTTVRDLAAGVRVVAEDHRAAERIKGDVRMADVLARALAAGRRSLESDVVVSVGLRRLVLPAPVANDLAASVASRRLPYEVGRTVVRDLLVDAVVALSPLAGTGEHARLERAVRAAAALTAAVDRLWPSISAGVLVRKILTDKSLLAAAAEGLLTRSEQADARRPATPTESLEIRSAVTPPPAWELRRPTSTRATKPKRREPWTTADVALLDEASLLLTGESRTYGYVVVDEAQDLSPMQLRMVARRAPAGAVTLLGDLAQASGAWAPDSWESVVDHLPTPDGWRLAELRLGYRSPAEVIELASRLLPSAAPGVTPTEAVRSRRGGVTIVEGSSVVDGAAREAGRLAALYGSVAVVTAAGRMDDQEGALRAAGVDAARADGGGLVKPVTLVEAHDVKGLEFDAVVVADPAAIVADAGDRPRGLRLLYVALTRPTQALAVVHGGDLPAELQAASA